jgi:hypothetical protein
MSLTDLFNRRLPINRKERYYTGTVFPGIVCADNFKNFKQFLEIIKCCDEVFDISVDTCSIQFFTEYGLYESSFSERFEEFYPEITGTRDTPDILILLDDPAPLLIAIEAKMCDSVSKPDLIDQMNRQEKEVLSRLGTLWDPLRIVHLALLPKLLAEDFGDLGPALDNSSVRQVITWEGIYDAFKGISSALYFLEVLRIAILNYPRLKADRSSGQNAQGRLAGEDILALCTDDEWAFKTMGRQGGRESALADIKGGAWQKQTYELNKSPIPLNRNWFLISEFVEFVRAENLDISN